MQNVCSFADNIGITHGEYQDYHGPFCRGDIAIISANTLLCKERQNRQEQLNSYENSKPKPQRSYDLDDPDPIRKDPETNKKDTPDDENIFQSDEAVLYKIESPKIYEMDGEYFTTRMFPTISSGNFYNVEYNGKVEMYANPGSISVILKLITGSVCISNSNDENFSGNLEENCIKIGQMKMAGISMIIVPFYMD